MCPPKMEAVLAKPQRRLRPEAHGRRPDAAAIRLVFV